MKKEFEEIKKSKYFKYIVAFGIIKKVILLILLLIPLLSFGQEYTTSDGVLLSELNERYIIVSKARVYNKNTTVSLEYGQELTGKLSGSSIKLNGKNAKFPSVLNIINLLKNYEVVEAINSEYDIQYLLRFKAYKK